MSIVYVVLHSVSAVLSLISVVFFLIGCIGYADTSSVIKNTAWITIDQSGVQIWLGLQKLTVTYQNFDATINYAHQSQCDSSICDTCERDGKGAFGLMVGATVFALAALSLCATSILMDHKDSRDLRISAIIMALMAVTCGCIALGLFMHNCLHAIDQNVDNVELDWGPGSVLTIIGVLLMGIVFVLQLVVDCLDHCVEHAHQAPDEAKPATATTDATAL